MTEEPINEYGDTSVSTTGAHGIDVASQRIDALDRAALRFALDVKSGGAIDIGCGLGHQGIRFALLGLETTLVDLIDLADRTETVGALLGLEERLTWRETDARELTSEDLPRPLRIAFSQRFLHYLTFEEAADLLSLLAETMRTDAGPGRLYVSASGIESELANGYADRDRPVADRFAPLSSEMQERHEITAPVCLYDAADMAALFEAIGIQPVDISTSAFGNVKAIGEVS